MLMMGSKEAELYQKSIAKKRKKLDARAFKALFKRQRTKEDFPDIHGKLEGPDNMSHIYNDNGRVINSKPIGGVDVSDECCKRFQGNLRHSSIDKESGGDLQKSIESPKPLGADSLTDTRIGSSTRKSFDDSERLPTGCSITENTSISKSGSADCMVRPQHVDPAIGELTELQGTQVAASKEGHSTTTANNLAESLQMDSISTDHAPNSVTGQSSFGAKVGTGGSEGKYSLLSEQNNRHNFLRVELERLCQIVELSEDATHKVREFLEYVIQNHDISSDTPAIIHAFQLSVCWIATRIAKQKVDKKDTYNLAKKHLNYQCTEEQVCSVYSKMRPLKLKYLQSSQNASDSGIIRMLADEDSKKEPYHIIDGTPSFSLSKEKKAKLEIKEIVEIVLKQNLGMNAKTAGSEIHEKIKKIRKKCEKLLRKLVRKQEEEVQGLVRTWEEEKVELEKENKMESAVTRYIHAEGLVQTSKLKILGDNFAKKMEEHNLLKDVQLNSLKEKHLAARNEEYRKAADWLAGAIACASKLGTGNGPQPFDFKSQYGPECTESGKQIGLEDVVTMFQEHAENPSINLCPQGNDVATSDASINVPTETVDSGCLVETMSNMGTFSPPKEVGVMSLERPSETLVGKLNQLVQSCNITEEIGAANLPVCGEQITDEIRPVETCQEGPTVLTKSVSDDIVLHGDPVESNNTSNIGDSIVLPDTEVSHVSGCRSSNDGLPFPLVHSEEMLPLPDHRGLLKHHVSKNEIHLLASAELEDRDTPAAEIRSTSQVEVEASELSDAVALVQSNQTVSVTGNCEQLNLLSADASLVCDQHPPHEIEHQNRDQGTNFSPTVVARETEDFSHDFISQSGENLHHNHLILGQTSRISHEQNVELVHSPDSTVMSEVVSTTELPNQAAPRSGIDAGHLHEPINNDTEITRSTCIQESQNENHQMASAELEKLDTSALEIKNTSQTEVASDAVNLVQSNHAVPVTGNYEQLHQLSVDASLICNQSSPNEMENQNGEMGQESRISHVQSVEMFVRSPGNTVMAQASTTARPNQSVPQMGIGAGHLRGPSHLLVHPTHPVTSRNSTPSLVADPLQNELEKLLKEAVQLEKIYGDAVSQLKSSCEKEIQEIINQIRTKYDQKLQEAEANFRLKKNELEKSKNLVLLNTKLAEAFRYKFHFRPLQLHQVFKSSFEQHLHPPSLQAPMTISPSASASRPPSQQTSVPSAEALNQLHMPSARSSPVAIRNFTASQPIEAMLRAGSVLSGTSARPLVIASHTPAANPHIAEIRSRAPHLQPFRLPAAPYMAPSSFSAMPQRHPQLIFPPQLIATPRPSPPPPRQPQLIPNHVPQNTLQPRSGQPIHLNLTQSPIDLLRDMNSNVLMKHNLPPLADFDSTVGSLEPTNHVTPLGNIQGNTASSAVDTNIICLSDED
ncbi:uncharacterized protein [Henckelia pumila]|uniref:uncharacterized protein isoform X2 n=1 Tax=Henckelia pumila TaxID=405737 RepID=UPI003C6E2441